MADIVLEEGPLEFTFQNVNFVEKYDEWSHYQNKFQNVCGGSKAVDFVVVQGKYLWLIEVINYRQCPKTEPPEPIEPQDISEEVTLKIRDTLVGLVSTAFKADDIKERARARQALTCSSIHVVLHLEQPDHDNRLYRDRAPVSRLDILESLRRSMRFIDSNPAIINKERLDCLSGLQLSVR